jgi:hypothetical protein
MTVEQMDLFKANITWVHFFKDMVRSKQWAGLSGSAAKVYMVIKTYSNWRTGEAHPSLETIVEYSGVVRNSAIKACKELEEQGMIRQVKAAGKQTRYQVIETVLAEDPASGEPMHSISFDYMPLHVTEVVKDIKTFLASGIAPGTHLTIKNLTINIQNNAPGSTGTINNIGLAEQLTELSKSNPELAKSFRFLLPKEEELSTDPCKK